MISALSGLILWSLFSALSGAREPWDAPEFWTLGWPIAAGLAFAIGLACPRGAWRWGAVVMLMLMPVMLWNGAGLSLLPLGFVLLAILSLPPCLAGVAGSAIGRRLRAR